MKALVLGHTGGIGAAVADLLSARDYSVTGLSRSDGLDWQDPERAEAALSRSPGPFSMIFDATGALEIDGTGPEKQLSAVDADAMAAQFVVNAIGPALLFKHARKLLVPDQRAVIATISARVGSIGDNRLGGWISYRAAKAALNQIVRTASIELARTRPDAIVAALHPGTVRTNLSARFVGDRDGIFTPEQSAGKMLDVLDGLAPSDSGGFFAYDGSVVPW